MNLVRGILTNIFIKEGTTMGTVNVHGAIFDVPLTLLLNAKIGDIIIIDSGIAI